MATSVISALDGFLNGSNVSRTHVTFKPSMWNDTFTTHSADEQVQEKYNEAIEELKEEVRAMLINGESTKFDKLMLIDTLEHLGVAYHFEKEIEDQLNLIFEHRSTSDSNKSGFDSYDDLFAVALEFRLLRQHFYDVSSEVFDKFKMKDDNKLDEAISSDGRGLLSLYEAAQARIEGEEILDEAVSFTTHHLNRMLPDMESPLQDKVKRALEHSLHRSVPIIEARHFIPIYDKDNEKSELLVKLAKLNFNFLQNMYRKELSQITCRWWNKFDLKTKLPYIRDRLVESFFWGVAIHFEPQYAYARSTVCKSVQLAAVLDDTYDNYATLEEGQLFTKILNKWDVGEIDELSDYMKIVYKFVWSTYQDLEREASERERLFIIPHLNESVKQICRAYLKELEWYNKRNLPTFEEYLKDAIITSCIPIISIPSFIGMKSAASIDIIHWVVNLPKLLVAAAKICRHMDDLGSWERESRDGQVPTGVDCYMKQYNLSRKETLAIFTEQADVGWKRLNTERLNIPASIPKDIANMFVNYVRAAEITYKNCQDGYTNPEKFLAPQIAALLIQPILL